MYTYMEYLQRCFHESSAWNDEHGFAHVLASSRAVLDFKVPDGARVECSSRTTEGYASSFSLCRDATVNGSLAYLYSLIPLKAKPYTSIPLHEAMSGFRILAPAAKYLTIAAAKPTSLNRPTDRALSLLYARMYFPGSALEGMFIRRFTPRTQVVVKCVSNPHVRDADTLVAYLQHHLVRLLRELVFSTNDALLGFRCLYSSIRAPGPSPKFDNSVVLIGTELWYAARSMSPGLSVAARYYTRSTATGKPLTMTVAANPILGHVSSTYTVKTLAASTVSSRYDFNCFSYASNLTVGFELFRGGSSLASSHTKNLTEGVFRCAADLNARAIKCLWEGRYRQFLVSTGFRLSVIPDTNRPQLDRVGLSFSYAC